MDYKDKILIGGQAMSYYGSTRPLNDTDYLIYDETNNDTFITGDDEDYINAANDDFFREIWDKEKGMEIISTQSLFDMKVYQLLNYYQNNDFQKADKAENDLKFLYNEYGLEPVISKKYLTDGQLKEITTMVNESLMVTVKVLLNRLRIMKEKL